MSLATVPTDVTLPEAFARGASTGAGITILGRASEAKSYAELLDLAAHRTGGLAQLGIGHGDPVCLFAHTSFDFASCLLALWNLGAIPVPLPYPPRAVPKEVWLEGSRTRIRQAQAKLVLLADDDPDPQLVRSARIGSLSATRIDVDDPGVAGTDVALYQFSSGSTGNPTGVVLTHRALAAQLDLVTRLHHEGDAHGSLTWLPLYHDLGLITHLLAPMANGMDLFMLPTFSFLKDPLRWILEMSTSRANVSSAPNFGFGLAARALERYEGDLDLSSWTQAYCGGEPVDPVTMDRFAHAAGRYGFDPGSILPGYGLAEATCVVTARRPGQGVAVDRVDRDELVAGIAASPSLTTTRTAAFVSVGTALHGVDVAIADPDGGSLPDRSVGEVVVRTPSLMNGYLDDLAATAKALRGEWLHTGDLGYLLAGELFVTGRIKDVIIVAGQNHNAEDIERVVLKAPDLRPGACICIQLVEESNSLVVLAEVADETLADPSKCREEIVRLIAFEVGLQAHAVVLLPPRSLPKTSSGKLQRQAAKNMYEEGHFTSLVTS